LELIKCVPALSLPVFTRARRVRRFTLLFISFSYLPN
jgi:hypothetical protein